MYFTVKALRAASRDDLPSDFMTFMMLWVKIKGFVIRQALMAGQAWSLLDILMQLTCSRIICRHDKAEARR